MMHNTANPFNDPRQHPLLYALRSRNEKLADQAAHLIRESHRILEYTVSTFPGGTDHTSRHTNTVERIAGMLLCDAYLAVLGDDELFFLTVVCHYHDLAMAGTEADDLTPETREQVRRDHAVRIGSIVQQHWAELGFEDQRTAQILGEICRGHRPKKSTEGEANWDELNSVEVRRPGVSVRVRLLSALIYAIDELHLGADRAPPRVQNWREIRDEESRRHWRRHQAINGPDRTGTGTILFQVNADTFGFEENLRAQVFCKALAAIADLRRQAEQDGVSIPLPAIEVQWNRGKTWEVLLFLACSDLGPRTKDEIVQVLLDRFADLSAERTNLAGLCVERGNTDDELRAGASRCVQDAITRRYLVEDGASPGGFILSAAENVADVLFSSMRDADALDRLFLGRYQARWEEQLFGSQYGRTYVATCVLPAVERSYSVPLTTRPDTDPLRVTLETCPTAALLVRSYGPPPSNLVKEPLLASAALSGALFDLHADPERLLDRRLRDAVRSLAVQNAAIMPTLRLLEEMALVGGFTLEQIQEAHTLSEAAQDALDGARAPDHQAVHIGITQRLPTDAPAATTHLPRLWLASQRSGTPILLTYAPGLMLDVRIPPEAGLPAPTMFGLGPGEPISGGPSRLPARIEVSKTSKTVRFYIGRFADLGPTTCPVILTIPPPPRPEDQPTTRFGGSIQWPELTVRDLRSLVAANQIIGRDGGQVELLVEDGALMGSMKAPRGGQMFSLGDWTADVLRGFRGIDGSLAVPLFIPVQNIAELGEFTPSKRNRAWKDLRETPPGGYRRVSSLFLRLTTDLGTPVEETFLQFFPFDLFPAPTIKADENSIISPEEFTRQWETGSEDFVMTAYFERDVFELSQELRAWCKSSSSREFPFRFDSGAVNTPLMRTVLNVRFRRARDRGWHLDRAIVFEFRPVNRSEAYQMEAAYWRSVNDDRRAELAEEIRARLAGS